MSSRRLCVLGGEGMRLRNVVFMTVVLVFIVCGAAVAQQWVDIKDSEELRALHSNKTFRGTIGGNTFVEYYRAEGYGTFISGAQRKPFNWEVKGAQVCVTYVREKGTDCWQFQRSKEKSDEYARKSLSDGTITVFKVEDGAPLL
jgi:hypothetical protein